jgi:Flp pilus assembly pilin Flp
MMSLAKQMYDYYVKPYLGEKGQDMVEYALMLAIIVGIGWLIYQQTDLANSINKVFSNANDLMEKANSQSAAGAASQSVPKK